MAKLRAILLKNGYPVHLVDWLIKNTVERKQIEPGEEEARYVSIWLPWIANRSTEFCRSIKQAVQKAFTRTVPRVIFTTSPAFSGRAKDVLPIMAKSCIVYEFKCRCKQAYIGKTTQRLSDRVNQHIPAKLLQSTAKAHLLKVPADSTITKHLKDNLIRRKISWSSIEITNTQFFIKDQNSPQDNWCFGHHSGGLLQKCG